MIERGIGKPQVLKAAAPGLVMRIDVRQGQIVAVRWFAARDGRPESHQRPLGNRKSRTSRFFTWASRCESSLSIKRAVSC